MHRRKQPSNNSTNNNAPLVINVIWLFSSCRDVIRLFSWPTASGRKRTFVLAIFGVSEGLLSGKADIAGCPKDAGLNSATGQIVHLYYAWCTSTIKPNPPKGGDGKPRVLASSEKPWKTSRRTQDRRVAEATGARVVTTEVTERQAIRYASRTCRYM